MSTCCFTKKKNEQKERKKSKQQQQSTNKQVGPPVNGCRGIISNHHRNITSDLCTSKPRRKNITQLVNDVTLNRKENGNDSRRSKRPGEKKKSCVLVLSTSSLFCPMFVRQCSQYIFFCASPFLTFPLPELLLFFKGTGDQRNDQSLFLLPQLLLAKLV